MDISTDGTDIAIDLLRRAFFHTLQDSVFHELGVMVISLAISVVFVKY